MKHRLVAAFLALLVVLGIPTLYIRSRVGSELSKANKILSTRVTELSANDIEEARKHLQDAHDILDGFLANVLQAIPIERQNLQTIRDVVGETMPVLSNARKLRSQFSSIQRTGLIRSGRLSLKAIRDLQPLLDQTSASVHSLVTALRDERSGWLLPGVWSGVTDALMRAEELEKTVATGSDVARMAPELLGASKPRRYLVLLLNNAEVRPSGGIVSGVGLLRVNHGTLQLGAFHYYTDLGNKPFRRVPAPTDFRRRYGRFKADTTKWVNATLSPDTEEVATVVSRLYKISTGLSTDGVILADPRGIAALLPPGTRVRVPGTVTNLSASKLADYIYSTAYSQLGGNTDVRHDALIGLGQSAFHDLLTTANFGNKAEVTNVASAAAGGHLRLISLRGPEEQTLRRAGVTGALEGASRDLVFVTDTNFNGTKLDFWTQKTVWHTCDLRPDGLVLCETEVAIKNAAPDDLSEYVAHDDPYGLLRNLIEVYLPEDAVLQRVLRDGRTVTFSHQQENGLTSIGVVTRILPGQESRVLVDYALPPADTGYSLDVTPQPLTHDPRFFLTLRMPPGWQVSGDPYGKVVAGRLFVQKGELGLPQSITAAPLQLRGFSALWQKIENFWNNPVF